MAEWGDKDGLVMISDILALQCSSVLPVCPISPHSAIDDRVISGKFSAFVSAHSSEIQCLKSRMNDWN